MSTQHLLMITSLRVYRLLFTFQHSLPCNILKCCHILWPKDGDWSWSTKEDFEGHYTAGNLKCYSPIASEELPKQLQLWYNCLKTRIYVDVLHRNQPKAIPVVLCLSMTWTSLILFPWWCRGCTGRVSWRQGSSIYVTHRWAKEFLSGCWR